MNLQATSHRPVALKRRSGLVYFLYEVKVLELHHAGLDPLLISKRRCFSHGGESSDVGIRVLGDIGPDLGYGARTAIYLWSHA
jgi:hypothetical protein